MEGNMRRIAFSNEKATYVLALEAIGGAESPASGTQRVAPMTGNMRRIAFSDEKATYVLALEAIGGADGPASGTQRVVPMTALDQKGYSMNIIMINAGEDIRDKILSFYEDRRKFPLHLQGHACQGVILSASGYIHSTLLAAAGTALPPVPYEEAYYIVNLNGMFSVDGEGQAQQIGNMVVSFANSNGATFGGAVIGPLIAANSIQIAVASFINGG